MEPIRLEFSEVPQHSGLLEEPVVAWGNFRSEHPGAVVYDSLSALYLHLILGRPLATRFILREILSVEHLLAISIFMDREAALSPKIPGLIASLDLANQLQEAGLAHIEPSFCRLILFLERYCFRETLDPQERARRLQNSLTWLRDYILWEKLPSIPPEAPPPMVLDTGTNGFVLAESKAPFLSDAVVELYRMGHLRGVLFAYLPDGRQKVVAFRKSHLIDFRIVEAATQLNQAESRVGEPESWQVKKDFLVHPGTRMPRDLMVEVFLRV